MTWRSTLTLMINEFKLKHMLLIMIMAYFFSPKHVLEATPKAVVIEEYTPWARWNLEY